MTTLPSCKVSGAVLAVLAVVTLGLANADRADALPPSARGPMKACPSDEGEYPGYPCVWRANVMGNGEGDSFRIYRDGTVKTITHRRAKQLLLGLTTYDRTAR